MEYLTVGQAAMVLDVDMRTLRHRLEKGQMAGERVTNRLWMIPVAEVERWKAIGKMKPGPKPRATTPTEGDE